VIGWQEAVGQPDAAVGLSKTSHCVPLGAYQGLEPPMAATAENRVYGRSPLPIPKHPAALRSGCHSGGRAPTRASQSRP
jgi:hypothetical protein